MLNEFSKKEAPIQGLAGMGGGVPSRLLTLASGEITYVDDVFQTFLYTGAGSAQTITNGIDLAGEGGLVWTKRRNSIRNNILFDSERGTASRLTSDTSNAAADQPYSITMNSDGYSWSASDNDVTTGGTFCSWTFRKCPGFFDIVTYTGNGSAGRTVAHNLGSVPGCIFIRRLDTSKDWIVYHRGLDSTAPEDYYIVLNDTSTRVDNSIAFNDTAPTDTEFTLGTYSAVNADGGSYIAYLFAHNDGSFGEDSDEAVIKCGSYTGSTSAVTVNLGFEPQYVLVKNTSTSSNYSNWAIFDNMRGITENADVILAANTSDPEGDTYLYSGSDLMNLSPTGFVVDPPGSQSTVINSNGNNFIYIAIRRPHKPPEAATEVFDPELLTSASQTSTPGFALDMAWQIFNRSYPSFYVGTRLTGNGKYLQTYAQNAEGSFASWEFDAPTGKFTQSLSSGSTTGGIQYFFKRAAKFFDIVTYTGNGVQGRNISHGLGVAPDFMFVKNRDTTNDDWHAYASGVTHLSVFGSDPDSYGNNAIRLYLNDTDQAQFSASGSWDHTHPSATTFRVGDTGGTNGNGEDLIAFLFASLDGVSKIGTYTGTGSNGINVDCGFTSGARLVIIKRLDSTGNWFCWDSARGIVSGNDPYVFLNSTSGEDTTTDYIDPLNAGFTVNGSSTAQLNTSGGKYLFFAIA